MAELSASVGGYVLTGGDVTFKVRSSLTMDFLMGAASQARAAGRLENGDPAQLADTDLVTHKSLVAGAIFQACAALECESAEIAMYGPGHHLGSSGTDAPARDFLAPLAGLIDRESVLERFALILHLVRKAPLERGGAPWQQADLAIRLRNNLVHYKSKWDDESNRSKFIAQLKAKDFRVPRFLAARANFFPHQCLSAECARWTVTSCVAFLEAFYNNLGFPDRLGRHRERLLVSD